MRVFLAWHNTCSNRRRLLAASSGIAFAILLMFMQVGSYEAVRRTATLVYDALEFDLILVSNEYQYLNRPGTFNATHLAQAAVIKGVRGVAPVNYRLGVWKDPDTEIESGVMILGIETDPLFVRDERIKLRLSTIEEPCRAMVDDLSNPLFGPLSLDRSVKINERSVTIVSRFRMGMGFYAQGAVIVNNRTFGELVHRPSTSASFGLIRLEPGTAAAAVRKKLREILPPEVGQFERSEFLEMEMDHYTTEMPLGIMGRIGVVVAIIVGAVILFQVLSTDISNRLDEYATLKAAGFTTRYIYGVGLQQSVIFALLGYAPAMALAELVFRATHRVTRLPIFMTWRISLSVLGLTLVMCLGAGVLALNKVRRADPADLF